MMTSHGQRLEQQRERLAEKARIFADEINYLLRETLPIEASPIHATAVRRRVVVTTTDSSGIPLTVGGVDVFRLQLNYSCELSESGDYLAVEKSSFTISHRSTTEPIMHFDYLRHPRSNSIPVAHVNVHAESEALRNALVDSGDFNRGRNADRRPSELHIPLGGHRFRPCLEDVLEMIINEFGIDARGQWRQEIGTGRAMWRERQLKAAIQDYPTAAAEALASIGYEVAWPAASPEPAYRQERLQRY